MTASNTYGRGVWLPLTNKSGGGVIAGDVVVVDTTNNDAFTTTTSANFTGGVGVAQGTIANNATGLVAVSGYVTLVNVNASVTRGQFGATYTVAKQATGVAARTTGTFCQWLTGGTTPDALLYPVDLLGSSLTNPMTTKGDIIQADTGGTPLRLAAGTSGYLLTAGGAAAFSAWAIPPASNSVINTAGDKSITTTTAADVDTTNLGISITTLARRLLVGFSGTVVNGAGNQIYLDIAIDGTRLSASARGLFQSAAFAGATQQNGSFVLMTQALTAAAHTVRLQAWVSGGTGLVLGGTTTDTMAQVWAHELF